MLSLFLTVWVPYFFVLALLPSQHKISHSLFQSFSTPVPSPSYEIFTGFSLCQTTLPYSFFSLLLRSPLQISNAAGTIKVCIPSIIYIEHLLIVHTSGMLNYTHKCMHACMHAHTYTLILSFILYCLMSFRGHGGAGAFPRWSLGWRHGTSWTSCQFAFTESL